MAIDMNRGRPTIDPTMPRRKCNTHGDEVAQSYVGRERYACWHCATAEYDRLLADPDADEPPSERPEPRER